MEYEPNLMALIAKREEIKQIVEQHISDTDISDAVIKAFYHITPPFEPRILRGDWR